ncbi:MAG: aminopeptidase N [Pseudomonadota bacterium]
MRDAAPQTTYLSEYKPFGFSLESVDLTFYLHPTKTKVKSRIAFDPNVPGQTEIFLHGENLNLLSAKIDGVPVKPIMTAEGLTCVVPDGPFVWEAEVEIDPQNNTALEGLYMSNGMYCTQCEAEGFRKITFYPDRPDVMSVFTVRIHGDAPVLLSNGNPVDTRTGFAKWHDPWPKPAYLFALVAGDLLAHSDTFKTLSGRDVALNLYVRPGDEGKCAFGMKALKASMLWDEKVYKREYDLDIFNIVAVDDFNMGAMENKGLNIFNSSAVLASPETSTDVNFERIEAIIAHEYFHNWTGNRITCRDWFQLCLKEGLTVFRDSQFTSDLRSAAVKRISDVIDLRARQFPEDQGPLAHPVRPDSYQEINNFYTATVYEKGAELIGMLRRLVGAEGYAKALDLYFERHDGEACTIEDWLKVFEESSGRDLGQFKRWYTQAGTPIVTVKDVWENGTYTLVLSQSLPPSAPTPEPAPNLIPITVGLLDPNGAEILPSKVLELTELEQSFKFEGLLERPIPSVLRDFSAPVVLERQFENNHAGFLLAHDTDPFNRWEAGRALAKSSVLDMIENGAVPNQAYLDGLRTVLTDETLEPAYRALMLGLPGQSELASELHGKGVVPDPQAIWDEAERMGRAQAACFMDVLPTIYESHQIHERYEPNADQSGRRSLANAALFLLSLTETPDRARAQFAAADNMTQQLTALGVLLRMNDGTEELQAFAQQWQDDRLVMDKWFGIQVLHAQPEDAANTAETLTGHPDFNWKNPNRFRAVFGTLAAHHAGFHHESGAGYDLLADWLIRLDPVNPQTTARMCSAFQTWRRYNPARQTRAAAALDRILATPRLSRDTSEMLTRVRGNDTL